MLVAYDEKTGKVVPVGSVVQDCCGNYAKLLSLDRVNEIRYGGCRSGMVTADWGDYTRCEFDKILNLEVRETDWEMRRWKVRR